MTDDEQAANAQRDLTALSLRGRVDSGVYFAADWVKVCTDCRSRGMNGGTETSGLHSSTEYIVRLRRQSA